MSDEKAPNPNPEGNHGEGSPTPASERAKASVSQRKLEANRRNAQKSTGPRTQAGKANSAGNSYKHGFYEKNLFAMTPPERVAEEKAVYLALLDGLQEHYQPVGYLENLFCERIAIGMFRCGRLLRSEGKIFDGVDPFYPPMAGNLVRYETSTNRQLQKDIAQLERLQEKRKAQSASLDAPESDENETDAQPDDPTPADGGNAGSSAIVVPLNESKAEENLDAVATPAETENAETKPTVTELRNEVSAEQNTGENHEPPKDAQRRKDIENDGNEASPSTFARLITEACHLDP